MRVIGLVADDSKLQEVSSYFYLHQDKFINFVDIPKKLHVISFVFIFTFHYS